MTVLTAGYLSGCSNHPSPARDSAGRPEQSLNFNDHSAVQDSVRVPDKADALLLVHPLLTNQPVGFSRTLAQLYVRIRSAGIDLPSELAGKPEGTPFLSATLTFKAAPGFKLLKIYGVPLVDSSNGTYKVKWDTLGLGDWRVVVAELEGSLPPSAGKERLIGATLRTTRHSDGAIFESIEGIGMEWHRQDSPAKLNAWTARNSLTLTNREALIAAKQLASKGEASQALELLQLQSLTTNALMDLDPKGNALELQRLAQAQANLTSEPKKDEGISLMPTSDSITEEMIRSRASEARKYAMKAPEGVWSTLAQSLVVREK